MVPRSNDGPAKAGHYLLCSSAKAGRNVLRALICLLMTAAVTAQRKPLTVEELYSYEGWSRFNGSQWASMSWAAGVDPWLSDTHHLWPGVDSSGSSWLNVEAATGASRPLFTHADLESALLKAGAPASDARTVSRRRPSNFNAARDAVLVNVADDLYLYAIGSARATRLTSSDGAKIEPAFSPDGRHVAFVKNNNLFVTPIDAPGEKALTSDGTPELLNGRLDWVYSEELYGRGNHRGFWWSPDSRHVAFLQFDETPVPEYTLVDDISYHPAIERWDYPKAGDPNPNVRLGVVPVSGGPVRWMDTTKYTDYLIVNVGWSPAGHVVFHVQDRQQRWLDFNLGDAPTGAAQTLFRETGGAWVERWTDSSADALWLNDGSFLWLSERTGWRHFYHYAADGRLIRQVTDGHWEIRVSHGIDRAQTWIYFSSTAVSPIGLDLSRVRVDGSGLQQLSSADGKHLSFLNPSRTLFLDSHSEVNTPPQVRLHSTDTRAVVRVVDANPVPALKQYGLSRPELLQVKTRDGFVMEAMMIKPPDFDPSKRYPVYQFTYAGPHSQQVSNAWGGILFMYHQLLAQRGIIVWICDNRTASGKGMQSAWPLHRRLGEIELGDIEDGLAWLKRQPYVDGTRIGISGVSYGGFMTLYALTHSRSFAMGIAEGAVSDWRNYDTIYTERYLGLPKDNPDGYRNSSPRFSAGNMHGKLLLIHSALDDNVHPQNATQFAYELQRAGKPFQMMIYPKSAHGVSDVLQAPHLRRLMLDFTTQNLLR
jgi:dipeptidyl-peptidase-4